MKKLTLVLALCSFGLTAHSQVDLGKMSSSNTWFKFGVNAAIPLAELNKTNTVGLGLDLGLQFLETKASGIGLKVGYLHYFEKEGSKAVDIIPLAIMYRYYPKSVGLFLGLEAGYAFISGIPDKTGGIFGRPQVGLHYYDWNFFGYYDHIVIEKSVTDIQALGIGITYNIRFNKK